MILNESDYRYLRSSASTTFTVPMYKLPLYELESLVLKGYIADDKVEFYRSY